MQNPPPVNTIPSNSHVNKKYLDESFHAEQLDFFDGHGFESPETIPVHVTRSMDRNNEFHQVELKP